MPVLNIQRLALQQLLPFNLNNEIDKAVDLAYRSLPFTSDANRMVFLFELYEKYIADLFTIEKTKKSEKQRNNDE